MEKKLKYLEYFILFSMGGWIYESIWISMIEQNKGFVNRGFFTGPWLPIYGFGMMAILLIIEKYKINKWYITFIISCIIACLCELLGSYVMELFTGSFLWDYKKYFLNFQGRIALKPELYFGFLSLLTIYKILPFYKKFREKYTWSDYVVKVIIIVFFIDIIYGLTKNFIN